jgi:hypothetical protein
LQIRGLHTIVCIRPAEAGHYERTRYPHNSAGFPGHLREA